MQLRDSLKPECIEVGMDIGTKEEALQAIVKIAKR